MYKKDLLNYCTTPALLVLLLGAVTYIYWPGLSGSFLFDDAANISKNEAIKITGLEINQLYQAWNSSPFEFPASRPLSMLTFGINHALGGLDPFWFKATNLVIHLLCGIGLFILTKLAGRLYARISETTLTNSQLNNWALLASAFWLLHPLNLTPVLYIVQRMTSLSALFTILALIIYVYARLRTLDHTRGGKLLLLVPIFGGMAFLCKENGALLPGFLLALEITLFQFRTPEKDNLFLRLFFLIAIILPITAGAIYLILNIGAIGDSYGSRHFNLEERVLTQFRVLWFYLQMTFVPDYTQLGFYHDDIVISKTLLDPPSTIFALTGIIGLIALSLLARKNSPILAFGILFFFIGHSLESSILPLELVYEHRNYLPDYGLLFALSYYLTIRPTRKIAINIARISSVAIIALLCTSTSLRARDWSNEMLMVLAEVKHHPGSPRANFRAGQLLISALRKSKEPNKTYALARQYLEKTAELNPRNADGLFGLIVLNLYAGRQPERQWLDELMYRLEHVPYDPQNITTSQFSYIVKWHMSNPNTKIPSKDVLGIFGAVLKNPNLDSYAHAGVRSALSAYYQNVLRQPNQALEHAKVAAEVWPQRWPYQQSLIFLLLEHGMYEKAEKQLQTAVQADHAGINLQKASKLEQLIKTMKQSAPSRRTR